MIELDAVPSHVPEVVGRILEAEAVLVYPQQGKVKVLNEAGALLWGAMDGAHTVGELAAALAAQFEVDAATAEADVREFLEALLARGLITLAERAA